MALHYLNDLKYNKEEAKALIKFLSSGIDIIGLDTETTSLDPFSCQLLLVQIYVGNDTYVLNRGKLGKDFFVNLINLINKNNITCVGHNIKFDAKVLRVDTGVWLNNLYDTMVMESVLTAGIGDKLTSLATLVKKYCDIELSKTTRLEFIDLNQNSVFTEQQINYAATDVIYLFDIYKKQMDEASKANLGRIIQLEKEVILEVCKMELAGISLDTDCWKRLTEDAELKAKLHMAETRSLIVDSIDTSKFKNALEFADALAIREPAKTKKARAALESIVDPNLCLSWVKNNFNVGSPKQLKTALLLAGVDTPDTNEKTLNKLPKNKIVDSILEFREWEKLLSTYGYNIIDLVNPVTHRIHTEYFSVGTVTGRFSSSNPNLQNIPPKYRIGFISKPGYSFLAMDYSQQEYRLAGAVSGDPVIIDAYVRGSDMHTATAAIRFKKDLSEVTSDERKFGKTMNFAVLYGTTIWGLKRNFNISLEEAKELLDEFWNGYQRLSAFKKSAEEKIVKLGYSVTPMGRRRYFRPLPLFATPYEVERYYEQMKREGFNMIIQGGGADITKLAMVKLGKDNPFGDRFNSLLQTHDEIVAEVEDSILKSAEEFMKYTMEYVFQPFLGIIPAKVDGRIGKNWGKG